jgi:hypothetical protein
MCRVYAYLRDGCICSKEEGGVWALGVLPGELHKTVRLALDAYRGNDGDKSFDAEALTRFTEYVEERMAELSFSA